MLKQETQEIDGLTFECTQFAAMRSFRLLARLLKIAGPAIAAFPTSGLTGDSPIESLAPVLSTALADVDVDSLGPLVVECLAGTTYLASDVKGLKRVELRDQAAIDHVFSSRLMTMFKVLVFALKTNYSDFKLGGDPAALPMTTAG